MKRFANVFRNLALNIKFILLFTVLISVPFLVSGALACQKFSSNIESKDEIGQLSDNTIRFP